MSEFRIKPRRSGKTYNMLLDVIDRGVSCDVVAANTTHAESLAMEFWGMVKGDKRSIFKTGALEIKLPNGEVVRFVTDRRDLLGQHHNPLRAYDHLTVESAVGIGAIKDYLKYAVEAADE